MYVCVYVCMYVCIYVCMYHLSGIIFLAKSITGSLLSF